MFLFIFDQEIKSIIKLLLLVFLLNRLMEIVFTNIAESLFEFLRLKNHLDSVEYFNSEHFPNTINMISFVVAKNNFIHLTS